MNDSQQLLAVISGAFGVIGLIVSGFVGVRQAKVTSNSRNQVTTYEQNTKRIDQVINGMQKIIDSLQEENAAQRQQLIDLRKELGQVREQLVTAVTERASAVEKLVTLEGKYEALKIELKSKHVIENGHDA